MAVPWAEVRRGAELEERRGLVPVVAVAVAWVFEPGSSPFINTTKRPIYPVRCPGVEGMDRILVYGRGDYRLRGEV